ncbi:MAG TPA: hypothetical protein VK694_06335 [Verrucomicrobiae bacterium]|nr:hypothetical protein [Verrucomicrobiae bacterium]
MRGLRERPSQYAPEATEVQKSRGWWGPKRILGIVMLFGAGFFIWGYHYIQSPAEGTVRTTGPTPRTEGVSTTIFTGKSFTVELPGTYKSLKVDAAKAPTQELASLSQVSALENRRISITIKNSPPANFSEESALQFRQHSAEYVSGDAEVAGQKAIETSKKDGSEITYFVPGKNAYAIIATTSTNPRDSYNQEITEIINSFKWR